jgi:hypothetical protein
MKYKIFYIADGKTYEMEAETVLTALELHNTAKDSRPEITRFMAVHMPSLTILVKWDR